MSKHLPRIRGLLQTWQRTCHDPAGEEIPCHGTGQDAAFYSGQAWPEPRFKVQNEIVHDKFTHLNWLQNANITGAAINWYEALEFVAGMNARSEQGFNDWRLPNRRELRSLISHQTCRPALPEGHPFTDVMANGYWSSTTVIAHPDHAWYIHVDGGRMLCGGKDQAFMLWPVRGESNHRIAATGQQHCYDRSAQVAACDKTGQDGEYRYGLTWPSPRFEFRPHGILDRLTGLLWWQQANITEQPVSWEEALQAITQLNAEDASAIWYLPNINELESLVDCARHTPALPADHPFTDVHDIYWSSTTSLYEPDWAWALYLNHGAIGVGQKSLAHFHVWAVTHIV